MAIVKWRKMGPWWPSVFDDDLWNNWPSISDDAALSGMDIYETDDHVVVKAQVPGIKEENVKVTIEGNVLTISASQEETDEEKEGKKTVYKSTCQKSFNYSTSLPRMVDASQAEAEVENGVVEIKVPKTEEEKPKQIEVKKKLK
ncbi:Hsp20/alpha crystallin family protein [Patescibacteria group bacterium]|nr:Hsp20/alpha crystallin family protein [Patescibacteria group bacterium]